MVGSIRRKGLFPKGPKGTFHKKRSHISYCWHPLGFLKKALKKVKQSHTGQPHPGQAGVVLFVTFVNIPLFLLCMDKFDKIDNTIWAKISDIKGGKKYSVCKKKLPAPISRGIFNTNFPSINFWHWYIVNFTWKHK